MQTETRQSATPGERRMLAFFAAISLVVRAIAYFRYRFDSDEPQHLHVAWGWTAGLVQYRDYFDNHAPLFHMVTAPFLAMAGERANVLLYMRALMLPLWAIVLWAAWGVARRFWEPDVAPYAVVILALFPPFFLKSIEYRTDNLWNAVWSIALVVLTGGLTQARGWPSLRRAFLGGVTFGVALCVSMKTPLLIFSLVAAAFAAAFAFRERIDIARYSRIAAVFLAGFVILPVVIAAFFISRHAWPQFVYCTVTFNEFIARTHTGVSWRRAIYPIVVAAILYLARGTAQRSDGTRDARWRIYFGLVVALFFATLGSFWVLISPRDYLPMMPLLACFAAAPMVRIASARRRVIVFSALSIIFVTALGYYTRWLHDGTREDITMMNQVLALTHDGEPLQDYKGETIYRRRPFYYVLEMITRQAMQRALLPDTIAEDLVRAGCHVVQADGTFWPPRSRDFMSSNFLNVGRLRVSGQWLGGDGSFSIAIPGQYIIVGKPGPVAGRLDGSEMRGARWLTVGRHFFSPAAPQHLAVVWAPAIERGFSPFHLRDIDF